MIRVPRLPRLLGLSLALPQIAAAIMLYAGPQDWRPPLLGLSVANSGLALALVGGSWWGLAAGAPAAERRGALGWLWFAGALPMFIALACLSALSAAVITHEPALIMLAGTHLMSVGVDTRIAMLAPPWWLALRIPQAITLGVSGAAAAFA